MSYVVVEKQRVLRRYDRSFTPECGTDGCILTATHEVHDMQAGGRYVARGCEPHAHDRCDELNGARTL
jgi:hypothetical protein